MTLSLSCLPHPDFSKGLSTPLCLPHPDFSKELSTPLVAISTASTHFSTLQPDPHPQHPKKQTQQRLPFLHSSHGLEYLKFLEPQFLYLMASPFRSKANHRLSTQLTPSDPHFYLKGIIQLISRNFCGRLQCARQRSRRGRGGKEETIPALEKETADW